MTQEIDCSDLYKIANGYECDGGRYNQMQYQLQSQGWYYDINTDSWKKDDFEYPMPAG